jgi:hypothetical protein
MRRSKVFDDFVDIIYIVHHDDEDGDGYYLAFDDEVDAAEDAEENDSEVAMYTLESHGYAKVTKEVVYELN